jgi:hypothetical protein
MDETRTPNTGKPLRPRQREELLCDLADGTETHEALGVKYGVSTQAVHNTAFRHKDKIAALKDAIVRDLVAMWGANKRLKLAELEGEYAAIEEELDDPTLSHAARIKYRNLKRALIHDMNEMCGQLPTRATVEVESTPILRHVIDGWSPDKWMDGIRAGTSSDPEPVTVPETERSEDGDNVDRLFRVQPSSTCNDGHSAATPSPPDQPSEVERFAVRVVAKVRVGGMLPIAQIASGLAQEHLDEVLWFVLSQRWLALRGDRLVLGAEAPLPPAYQR